MSDKKSVTSRFWSILGSNAFSSAVYILVIIAVSFSCFTDFWLFNSRKKCHDATMAELEDALKKVHSLEGEMEVPKKENDRLERLENNVAFLMKEVDKLKEELSQENERTSERRT